MITKKPTNLHANWIRELRHGLTVFYTICQETEWVYSEALGTRTAAAIILSGVFKGAEWPHFGIEICSSLIDLYFEKHRWAQFLAEVPRIHYEYDIEPQAAIVRTAVNVMVELLITAITHWARQVFSRKLVPGPVLTNGHVPRALIFPFDRPQVVVYCHDVVGYYDQNHWKIDNVDSDL